MKTALIQYIGHAANGRTFTMFSKHFSSCNKKLPILTLYTKYPCPLCDEAKEALKPALNKVQLEEVDITAAGNEVWWKLYKYDIPVFHLNGQFLMKHRGNLELLEKKLECLETTKKLLDN